MLTRAERTSSGFKITGTKRWITNGNLAHIAIIWAKLDGRIRGFIVPTNAPGFTAQKIERKFSLRASVTSELILEDVRIPKDAMLPNVGAPSELITVMLAPERSSGREAGPANTVEALCSNTSSRARSVSAALPPVEVLENWTVR
jgi:glutaryl-CoA dehydrogenase